MNVPKQQALSLPIKPTKQTNQQTQKPARRHQQASKSIESTIILRFQTKLQTNTTLTTYNPKQFIANEHPNNKHNPAIGAAANNPKFIPTIKNSPQHPPTIYRQNDTPMSKLAIHATTVHGNIPIRTSQQAIAKTTPTIVMAPPCPKPTQKHSTEVAKRIKTHILIV
jgi:hypothetical protein